MSDTLVRRVAERFDAFAGGFHDDQGDGFAYALKIAHTKRVLALAEAICAEERLPADVTLAARLAALAHDVGRFPQYQKYRTFRDAESANHAALSVTHTLREKLLADVPTAIRKLALGAVYLHNKRFLPLLSSPALKAVAQVVRDSDKLDIYGVMIDHFSQEKPKHPEVALSVIEDPLKFTPGVLEGLLGRVHGDYRAIVYVNDFKLMVIGWVYDMNYPAALRILKERGHIDALFATLPKEEGILRLQEQVESDLAERLIRA